MYCTFEVGWNSACHQYLREYVCRVVTRYEVGKIASKVYTATLTPVNIQSAFKRCGFYPFNSDVVSDASIAHSLSFQTEITNSSEIVDGSKKGQDKLSIASDARSFLENRGSKVLQNVPLAKTRKTLSKVVGGKAVTEDQVFDAVKTHISDQKSNKSKRINTPVVSTSGIPNKIKKSKDYVVANTDSDVQENDILDSDKCIVCRRHNVKDIDKLPYLTMLTGDVVTGVMGGFT
ncbi:uncharacterized protein LOC132718700 [Ruditapes philippinarum]|uniref:uncharacterized protein LOC132718700 n=1 Tax=Ruditapes philippinarum TaxID=129788 RepID=UPI00295BF19B|nr:uncharacterized protein LOC132718700 [Ruditapes philippinarum]